MHSDPISDFLTRIRNAVHAGHKIVEIPASKIKLKITEILFNQGYILSYKLVEGKPYNTIKIALKYHPVTKEPAITKIQRVSKPGLRKYAGAKSLPKILNGLGIAIVSTPKGLMTDKQARAENLGGELICFVY